MDLGYPGDDRMGSFKSRWDYMVRHCITQLSDRDMEGMLVRKLRDSIVLKTHLDHYDRCDETHVDHCYAWVSR